MKMKSNDGTAKKKAMGMTIWNPYGKDTSDAAGSPSQERIGKCGGSTTDLSHSLSGTNANQRQRGSSSNSKGGY